MSRTDDLFGPGPWDDEPDTQLFQHDELLCRLNRSDLGFWCGYVCVPKGHPWFGKERQQLRHVRVHGTVTFAGPAAFDDGWWVGFDCGHAFDLVPAYNALREALGKPTQSAFSEGTEYRTRDYAFAQTTLLAAQAVAAQKAEQLN